MNETHLRARDWLVRTVAAHSEAVAMCRAWHYSRGAPNTSTHRHGLYERDAEPLGVPFGVAIWIPPTKPAAQANSHGHPWTGVLALSRLVVAPGLPTNAASFLLGRSMRLIDRHRWPVLLTYADINMGHTGAIYKATNWDCDGEVPAGDVWLLDGRMCGRKRGGRTYTRAEMEAMGAERMPAAGKIRFVHVAKAKRR